MGASYRPDGGAKWEAAMAALSRRQEVSRPSRTKPSVTTTEVTNPPEPALEQGEPTNKATTLGARRAGRPKKPTMTPHKKARANKLRRAERAVAEELAVRGQAEVRLAAQRLIEGARRSAYLFTEPADWWLQFSSEEQALIRQEFLQRFMDAPGTDGDDEAVISSHLAEERRLSAALWATPLGPRLPRRRESVARFVPGMGLNTALFLQVDPDYYYQRVDRIWPYVERSGGPASCWPWHGSPRLDSDYGSVSWHGQPTAAHRVTWSLANGLEVPDFLAVDHLCCCKWCVNPDHLEPVTPGENTRRNRHRPSSATRTRTSFTSPYEDRWYPFGRRLYDEAGNRLDPADKQAVRLADKGLPQRFSVKAAPQALPPRTTVHPETPGESGVDRLPLAAPRIVRRPASRA